MFLLISPNRPPMPAEDLPRMHNDNAYHVAIADGSAYFGSDDGYVYCLDGKDGSLVWKYRPGPSDEKIIGNDGKS